VELILESPALAYASVAVLGLIFGSFLNVVILRLPKRLEVSWRRDAREMLELEAVSEAEPASVAFSRSSCTKCGTALKWYHNVPLLGFVFLRGKCGYCKAPISWQYPLVELLTAIVLVVCFWRFGPSIQFLAAAGFSLMLIALTGIDFRTQLLPDQLTYPLLWAGLALSLLPVFVAAEQAVIGALFGYLSLWSVFWLFKLSTGKEGMGYGDFKLLAALGAWCGPMQLPLIVILSAVVGSVVGGILLAIRKESTAFAFGPYLAIAGWIALLFGPTLTEAYLRMARF